MLAVSTRERRQRQSTRLRAESREERDGSAVPADFAGGIPRRAVVAAAGLPVPDRHCCLDRRMPASSAAANAGSPAARTIYSSTSRP